MTETLGLLYADHFPYRQMASARGVRRSPLHEHLKARGAVFGEVAGWERANWFAARRPGARIPLFLEAGRTGSTTSATSTCAVRNGVGLFDMTLVRQDQGRGARCTAPSCSGSAPTMSTCAPGRIVYTQMLNQRGGIESDLTVSRLSETAFLLVVPGATLQRDLAWLRRHLGEARCVVITDVTRRRGRALPDGAATRASCSRRLSPNDFSNASNPFGTFQEIEIGMGLARAHRVTYVGELGWELYVSSDQAAHVFETLEAGRRRGRAEALRPARAGLLPHREGLPPFRPRHHRRGPCARGGARLRGEDRQGRVHRPRRGARSASRACGARLVQFRLRDPEPLLFHNEAIVRDGDIVGTVTSGNYGHTLGGAVGLGYVPCPGRERGGAARLRLRRSRSLASALRPMRR